MRRFVRASATRRVQVGARRSPHVGKPRGACLEVQVHPVRRETDGVVPTAQQQGVQDLRFGQLGGDPPPQLVIDLGGVVQRVGDLDENTVPSGGPAQVCRTRHG